MLTTHKLQAGEGWRQTVARLLLVCFVVRALLPVGFMPTFGATGDQSLHFVLCLGDANAAQAASNPASPDQGDPSSTSHDQCAFSFLPRLALPETPGIAIAPLLLAGRVLGVAPSVGLIPIVAGPSLGQRAPPPVPRLIA